MRKITYASVREQGEAKTIYSSATTWGALKKEEGNIAMMASGMKAWLKNEQRAISGDGDTLPTGEFDLVFLVTKNDSGKKYK